MSNKFIRLNGDVLLEYIYNNVSSTGFNTNHKKLLLLTNSNLSTNYVLSANNLEEEFGNVLNKSAVELNKEFVFTNQNLSYNALDYLDELTNTNDLPLLFSPDLQPVYDELNIHLPSGYNFENNLGLLVRAYIISLNGERIYLTSRYISNEEFLTPNSKSFLLGQVYYSYKINVKILSTQWLLNEQSNSNDTNRIFYKISNTNGLLPSTQINFELLEVNNKRFEQQIEYFNAFNVVSISINPFDITSDIFASIDEQEGYFLLKPNWINGSFEEYISQLNRVGGDWNIINDIEILEQIGNVYQRTSNWSYIQRERFDEGIKYRPIIENASTAVSYKINYTLRLYDSVSNEQIYKQASFISFDVKKWGIDFKKINLGTNPVIDKIYNLVQKNTLSPFVFKSNNIEIKYVTKMIDNYKVFINNNNQKYSQGVFQIVISNTRSEIEFLFYNDLSLPMNLNGVGIFNLEFDGLKKIIIGVNDTSDLSNGKLLFTISKDNAKDILSQTNKNFHITLIDNTNNETLFYRGTWISQSDFILNVREKEFEIKTLENNTLKENNILLVNQNNELTNNINELNNKIIELNRQISLIQSGLFVRNDVTNNNFIRNTII